MTADPWAAWREAVERVASGHCSCTGEIPEYLCEYCNQLPDDAAALARAVAALLPVRDAAERGRDAVVALKACHHATPVCAEMAEVWGFEDQAAAALAAARAVAEGGAG